MKRIAVAAVVAAVALLATAGQAAAHEIVVVCDEETGELVWTNVILDQPNPTIVTSNGLTFVIPEDGTVRTPHPGPGTWTATWPEDGVEVPGVIPPECVDSSTTTAAPTTTAPPTTAPPTSEAGSNTVVPPSSAGSSSTGTLPETGSDLTVAAVGAALVAGGVLVTVVARRRVPTR